MSAEMISVIDVAKNLGKHKAHVFKILARLGIKTVLGFATNIQEQLRSLKTAAPFSKVLKTWPCKLLWEKTAIECASQDCNRLHTEVFRTESIDEVLSRCEQFFKLMPKIKSE